MTVGEACKKYKALYEDEKSLCETTNLYNKFLETKNSEQEEEIGRIKAELLDAQKNGGEHMDNEVTQWEYKVLGGK